MTTCAPALATGEPVLMPGVWDAISARLDEFNQLVDLDGHYEREARFRDR